MSVHPGEFSEVTHSIPQDWASLAHYLARRGIVFGPGPPRQFAGGYGNLNYLIEIDGELAVLRRPPAGPLPYGGNDMAREYRILSSLWREYPLAPRAMLFCEEVSVLGAPFQIIEYRPGMVIRDTLPPDLAGRPEVGMLLSRQLVEGLVALHTVDPARVGLETLGRPAGFLARTVDGWAARSAAIEDLINPHALSGLVDWLRRRMPADAPPSLIHSDFKLDNMILAPETLAPVAVIDWDMGTRGDPLWDLAVMLSYWSSQRIPRAFIVCGKCRPRSPGSGAGMKFSQPICDSAPAQSLTSPFIAFCRYSARLSFFFNYTIGFVGHLGRT